VEFGWGGSDLGLMKWMVSCCAGGERGDCGGFWIREGLERV
jgi:hypothetical protein